MIIYKKARWYLFSSMVLLSTFGCRSTSNDNSSGSLKSSGGGSSNSGASNSTSGGSTSGAGTKTTKRGGNSTSGGTNAGYQNHNTTSGSANSGTDTSDAVIDRVALIEVVSEEKIKTNVSGCIKEDDTTVRKGSIITHEMGAVRCERVNYARPESSQMDCDRDGDDLKCKFGVYKVSYGFQGLFIKKQEV